MNMGMLHTQCSSIWAVVPVRTNKKKFKALTVECPGSVFGVGSCRLDIGCVVWRAFLACAAREHGLERQAYRSDGLDGTPVVVENI